nr:MAG TPA: hypothetical protein [Caudoviricetes sp.]
MFLAKNVLHLSLSMQVFENHVNGTRTCGNIH